MWEIPHPPGLPETLWKRHVARFLAPPLQFDGTFRQV